jgi:hypothetical protein
MYCCRNWYSLYIWNVEMIDYSWDFSCFDVYVNCPKFSGLNMSLYSAMYRVVVFQNSLFYGNTSGAQRWYKRSIKKSDLYKRIPKVYCNDFLHNTHIVFHLSSQRAVTKSDNGLSTTSNYVNDTTMHIIYLSWGRGESSHPPDIDWTRPYVGAVESQQIASHYLFR